MSDSAESTSAVLDPERANAAPSALSARHVRESDGAYPFVVAVLNEKWRVIEGKCGIQWILQSRMGERWEGRRFHVERDALIRLSIRELCGEVCEAGLRALEALPRRHA